HRWQVNVRRDNNSAFGSQNTYALAYGYQITPSLRAQASYGTAFKAPSIYQLYNQTYGGNPDLDAETARNREIALVWEDDMQVASVTYYRNTIDNMIDWDATAPNPASPYPGRYGNVGRAKLEGVTLNYRGQYGAWRVRGTYDW